MRRATILLGALAAFVAVATAVLYVAGRGWLGSAVAAGAPAGGARPVSVVEARAARDRGAAAAVGVADASQILFGDLHVHSGFSLDALFSGLPMAAGGYGPFTVADACDFARYCSALDFWSINDHAVNLTPRRWRETIESVRQCDERGRGDAAAADMLAFLGWEWTQIGTTPANHFGHKNVVLRDLADDRIPTRPIAADSPNNPFVMPPPLGLGALALAGGFDGAYLDMAASVQEMLRTPRCSDGVSVRELPADCREYAATPAELFAKLDDWGFASLVIPHGTTWGNYTPPGSSFARQLADGNHDPERQRLVELFSGHGNTEEHRSYRAARVEPRGDGLDTVCPAPSSEHLPSCWQAGEIIRARCRDEGQPAAECEVRAAEARRLFLEAPGATGHLAVGGYDVSEWADSGQCRDCFLPAFNHRPGSSVQAMLAAREPQAPPDRDRFRFGIIASSDTHTARAGSGYKEVARMDMTDMRTVRIAVPGLRPEAPLSRALPVELEGRVATDRAELTRLGAYYYTGGLVAVHARERSRDAVWQALVRREVYGTSGPRILLWFDLLREPSGIQALPMGSSIVTDAVPRFRVRAVGSFEQRPGCPDYTVRGLAPDRLARLCRGECANPSDVRRPITRIEVIRIRPRVGPGEPLDALIEDPWRILPCDGDPAGCVVHFDDPDFAADRRDSVYYVRAIEAPTGTINAGGLACTPVDDADDCLAEAEPRAWSSPIFVDHARRGTW